jgi:hypothetical protein
MSATVRAAGRVEPRRILSDESGHRFGTAEHRIFYYLGNDPHPRPRQFKVHGESKMPLPITITDVPLGNDILRIELVELHGRPNFSARKFFRNYAGQWQPGAMGLAFYIESLPDIVAAFDDALSRAREERLLP